VVAAMPIFSALQTHLARSSLGRSFHAAVDAYHHRIVDAIVAGDAEAAGSEMKAHLDYLVPYYENVWRDARRVASRA
jgi:DNA-binding GntR family transcriptional regulator